VWDGRLDREEVGGGRVSVVRLSVLSERLTLQTISSEVKVVRSAERARTEADLTSFTASGPGSRHLVMNLRSPQPFAEQSI